MLIASPASAATLQQQLDAFVGAAGTVSLDPRTARECAQAPAIDWYGSLRRAVTVVCAGPPAWRLFVPVRPASGAAPAAAFQLAVVKRGDPVQIAAGGQGFQVTVAGAAEQDGRVGAHIRVRNLATGIVTAAVVDGPGNVSLPGYSSGAAGR